MSGCVTFYVNVDREGPVARGSHDSVLMRVAKG